MSYPAVQIVTGAALGMGEAAARKGAKVTLAHIQDEKGERVANAVTEADGKAVKRWRCAS
ncbi:MAG TPA: hypothetical protein ENH55_05780 [Aurantimonas coralicida]|uniref:Uncharacterized protein n=1 Tax=Aurantimonas coralicida TaxID=182270 RepID=A0A9C9THZ7_9HYPH|nr:hypothetical protein [Aurantimonas coralicida]HEU01995.1 hypothetical protein [Aurantimonas coralicida]